MFGIEVLNDNAHATGLDTYNGNTLCKYVIAAEMKAVRVVFNTIHGEEKVPPTYRRIRCHMIFDVSMEDFHHKARYMV